MVGMKQKIKQISNDREKYFLFNYDSPCVAKKDGLSWKGEDPCNFSYMLVLKIIDYHDFI